MKASENFGKNVAFLTSKYGSRREVANSVGISEITFHNIIRGVNKKGCAFDTAYAISQALGFSLDELALNHVQFKKIAKEKAEKNAE